MPTPDCANLLKDVSDRKFEIGTIVRVVPTDCAEGDPKVAGVAESGVE